MRAEVAAEVRAERQRNGVGNSERKIARNGEKGGESNQRGDEPSYVTFGQVRHFPNILRTFV